MTVVIRQNGRYVPAVNPKTREALDEPQQFIAVAKEGGFSLEILPRSEWVGEPLIMDVQDVVYR